MSVFRLPDIGEGLKEAEIVAWHVSEGDHVVADQPLVSVETDKAVVEIPSPQAGHVAKLHGAPGDIVAVGSPLVEFAEGAAEDAGAVVGRLVRAPAPKKPPPAAPAPAGPPAGKATPAVRDLARRLGVDLAGIAGSGPEGTITRADVEARADAGAEAPAEGGWVPVRGVRRAMAANMARAGAEIVPATVADAVDVEAWTGPGVDVTMRLVRAVAAACRAAPALNAWFDGRRMARILHDRIDLGIATDTPDGLFVPVLRDIGGRDAADLRRGLDRLHADVAARSIPRAEMTGQTLTLSNFGTLAGRDAHLVILPPQVAILGAGAIRAEVIAVDGAPAVRRVLPLSLTFDHRAVTGREAADFLAAALADLARPD